MIDKSYKINHNIGTAFNSTQERGAALCGRRNLIMSKKITAVLMLTVFLLSLAFSSCKDNDITLDPIGEVTKDVTRVYADDTNASEGVTDSAQPAADDSWKTNYVLEYNYADTNGVSRIKEIRCGDKYQAIDTETGYVSYFVQNGEDVEQYVLNTKEKTGMHTVSADSKMSELTSGFMQVAFIAPDFASSEAVVFEGIESVAGRPMKRYLQSVYTEGTLTAYAFVWIDSQYGFAGKCAVYTVEGSLYAAWELTSFSVGTVTESDVALSLDDYSITKE